MPHAFLLDPRKQGWRLVTPEIQPTTELRGGIIGAADLLDCIRYGSPDDFEADQERHRNAPDWFLPPCLFGFQFGNMEALQFRRFAGNVRFFTVPPEAADG